MEVVVVVVIVIGWRGLVKKLMSLERDGEKDREMRLQTTSGLI